MCYLSRWVSSSSPSVKVQVTEHHYKAKSFHNKAFLRLPLGSSARLEVVAVLVVAVIALLSSADIIISVAICLWKHEAASANSNEETFWR